MSSAALRLMFHFMFKCMSVEWHSAKESIKSSYFQTHGTKMPIDISLAIEKKVRRVDDDQEPGHLVSPGDIITRETGQKWF